MIAALAVAVLIASAFVLQQTSPGIFGGPNETSTAQPTSTSEPEIEFVRTVYSQNELASLAASPDYINVIAPLALIPGVRPEWIQFSADLKVSFRQQLTSRLGFPIEVDGGSGYSFLGDGCPDAEQATAACLAVYRYARGAESMVEGSATLGLDNHELEYESDHVFWATRYVPNDCAGNLSRCQVDPNAATQTTSYVNCEIVRVTDGAIDYVWSAQDHIPDTEIIQARLDFYSDPYHCNSVDFVSASDGQKILVSMRHTDSIYQIDVASGEVDWKLGGSEWPGKSLEVTNSGVLGAETPSMTFGGQHDAREWGDGSISVFDNGTGWNRAARGLTFAVNTKALTATVTGIFESPTDEPSRCTGSFRPISDAKYWVAGWGCSKDGITVFAANGDPIVSTRMDSDSSYNQSLVDKNSFAGPWALSYRATPGPKLK